MLKIILSGCNGRMGSAVTQLCAEDSQLSLVAGIDLNTVKRNGFPVYADLLEYTGSADIVIDFSSPATLDTLLPYLLKRRLPAVLATTGYSNEQQKRVESASHEVPLFQSGNMSLGINLLMDLVRRTASVLSGGFDVEIIERHHNAKLDSPSGTALMLLSAASDALPFTPTPVYDRHEVHQKREKNEIGIHSLRGGTIVGDHEVIFAGHNEVLELCHRAQSREVFAAGAVRAAAFLAQQTLPRIYNMQDLVASIT